MSPEIWAAVVGGIATVSAVALPLWRQGRRLKHVQNQVSNGHETNLRDDIDRLHQTVNQGFAYMGYRLDLVQTDLAWERRERIDLAERLEGKAPLA